MNLNALAAGMLGIVNPQVLGTVFISTGYTTGRGGVRAPKYDKFERVKMSVQALSAKELQHLDSLGIQNVSRAVYINGALDGVRRLKNKGGDMLAVCGSNWLVVQVLEAWDTAGWCKVAVNEQVAAP
jgi:hypothetical protein